jgi:hypothetical protein
MTSSVPFDGATERSAGVLESPWARVKNPTPIPTPLQPEEISQLADDQLQLLVRDNLLPRESDVDGRARWVALWALLADDPDLTELAFDVLEDLMDVTEDAIEDRGLDEAAAKRARKFLRSCEEAWARLQVDEQRPLGWAGRRAMAWDPLSRRVLEQLVLAIAEHRHQLTDLGDLHPVDEQLWAVLEDVGLDPANYRRGPRPPHPPAPTAAGQGLAENSRHLGLPLVDPREPMGWAGTAAAGFKPPTRPVLERLVLAIAGHRLAVAQVDAVRSTVDEPLWAVLGDVGLDPLELRRSA